MIRILQKDSKTLKIIFAVIISIVGLSMVAYLIPGIGDNPDSAANAGVYATVRDPGLFGKFNGDSTPIKTTEVSQTAQSSCSSSGFPTSFCRT